MRDEPCTAPNRDHRVMTARACKELAFLPGTAGASFA